MTTDCPKCGDPIADPLAVIESDGACPSCETARDELFDLALDTAPDRSPEEVAEDVYAMEAER